MSTKEQFGPARAAVTKGHEHARAIPRLRWPFRISIQLGSASHCLRRVCSAAGIVLCLVTSLVDQAVAATEPRRELKRVLLLHSFGADSQNITQIRAALDRRSHEPLEIFDASFATARPSDETATSRYADYLAALFSDQRLDLAIVSGSPSIRFFQRYRSQFFPSTPMVMLVEGRRLATINVTANDTAVVTTIDFAANIENILRVLPDTNHVAVVIGSSAAEQFWAEVMRTEFQRFAGRVSFSWFNNLSLDEILSQSAALPPRSAIFFWLLLSDGEGIAHKEDVVLARLHGAANAPIFSYYDANFGNGIVGGPLISMQKKGELVADVALRVLGGERPADIKPAPIGFAATKFDWREMQRWGISEARLPPESEIHFRTPTTWEQYRVQILSAVATILFQAGLICWLILEHRQRHRAEVRVRNSMAELAQINRVATAGELSASIAHEVNQPLTAISTRAGAALRWLAAETPDVEKARVALTHIVSASHRASDIISSVRAMFKKGTSDRHLVDINHLVRGVLSLLRLELRKNDIELRLELGQQLPPVEGDKIQLQQVVLNLIMNAIESMHSTPLRILRIRSDEVDPGTVRVSIEDTGAGIDPANVERVFKPLFTTKSHGMGVGLSICHSIIEGHDGRIWVSPGASGGSIFQFELRCCSRLQVEATVA